MNNKEIKDLLEVKVVQYNKPEFIDNDPIEIPHFFKNKADIEISAFLVATFAWGQRKSIIKNGFYLMELMDNAPSAFISEATTKDINRLKGFVHRTFQFEDLKFFVKRLQQVYNDGQSLESLFAQGDNMFDKLNHFHGTFLDGTHLPRTNKHVAYPAKGSAAKRLNMFLRWMVRKDKQGVDFGLWSKVNMRELCCPLDVHTGNAARKLGFIKRNANDWKAVEELQTHLRSMDADDPVKYDFALFGLGRYEGF